jgi:hypothetical protein
MQQYKLQKNDDTLYYFTESGIDQRNNSLNNISPSHQTKEQNIEI